MKKVVAKHWLKVGDAWYAKGEVFEVESLAGIANAVEVISDEPEIAAPVEPVKEEPEPVKQETPKAASTRRRKTTTSK